jgi:hypothetical protein
MSRLYEPLETNRIIKDEEHVTTVDLLLLRVLDDAIKYSAKSTTPMIIKNYAKVMKERINSLRSDMRNFVRAARGALAEQEAATDTGRGGYEEIYIGRVVDKGTQEHVAKVDLLLIQALDEAVNYSANSKSPKLLNSYVKMMKQRIGSLRYDMQSFVRDVQLAEEKADDDAGTAGEEDIESEMVVEEDIEIKLVVEEENQ